MEVIVGVLDQLHAQLERSAVESRTLLDDNARLSALLAEAQRKSSGLEKELESVRLYEAAFMRAVATTNLVRKSGAVRCYLSVSTTPCPHSPPARHEARGRRLRLSRHDIQARGPAASRGGRGEGAGGRPQQRGHPGSRRRRGARRVKGCHERECAARLDPDGKGPGAPERRLSRRGQPPLAPAPPRRVGLQRAAARRARLRRRSYRRVCAEDA